MTAGFHPQNSSKNTKVFSPETFSYGNPEDCLSIYTCIGEKLFKFLHVNVMAIFSSHTSQLIKVHCMHA